MTSSCWMPPTQQCPPASHCAWKRFTAHYLGLATHPDQCFRRYISDGLHYGFQVGFNYCRDCRKSLCSMSSAMDQPQVTWDYLAKECSGRRVLGQLDPLTLPQVHISHFGVMLKGDSGKWCLIVGILLPPGWDTSPAQRRNCVGKLGHASRAVVPGKMFMQHV